jgi:hypothetical protein
MPAAVRCSEGGQPDRRRPAAMIIASLAVLTAFTATRLSGITTAEFPEIPDHLLARYDSAYFAWDRGDYLESLRLAERILTDPGGEVLLDRVALLTGELYRVIALADDGQGVRWSPDGEHFAFQEGAGSSGTVHVMAMSDDMPVTIASTPGWAPAFSPDGSSMVLLQLVETAALGSAREEEARARESNDPAAIRAAQQARARLETGESRIIRRSLVDGTEQVLDAPGIERLGLAYTGGGTPILFGREPGQADRVDIYLLAGDGEVHRLTDGPGIKGARLLPTGGDRLIYTIGSDRIAVHDLADGQVQVLEGTNPTVSADGSTLAYLSTVRAVDPPIRRGEALTGADLRGSGNLTAIMVMSLGGEGAPRAIKHTTLPIADPTLSPSGRRLAYSTVLRDDWEIFVMDSDGGAERRITRDPQHDIFPRFLTEDLLMGMMGEARHRRSYLYDLSAASPAASAAAPIPGDDQRGRARLFHNNTLRTVAPQYEWAPSPDGSRILFVADRDGDTVSPERGVYLLDLTTKVTVAEVLERIRAQREAEEALREWGRETFAPIAAHVREVVAEVEVGRIYDHAHALYQFDSKYFTQPGNALAIDYLASALRMMGYEPRLQWFEPRPGFRTANVIATLPGTTDPDRINVISSHFDSVEGSPGADDNSSGTTALLEAARVLAGLPQPETIEFAFLTAEEAGLLGAREYVRRAAEGGERIVSVINNDMVGWTRNHRLDNTIRYSNPVIRDIQHAAAIEFSELITYDARYVRSTDAQAFWDGYGDIVGGIGAYPILGNPHYHQPHDRLELLNHRLVAEVSRATVAAIMRLANGAEIDG